MKYAKALQSHLYDGKRRNVGDIYPIRRSDYVLMQKLGRIEIVPDPNIKAAFPKKTATPKDAVSAVDNYRLTTAMEPEPEPSPVKRPYRRKIMQDLSE